MSSEPSVERSSTTTISSSTPTAARALSMASATKACAVTRDHHADGRLRCVPPARRRDAIGAAGTRPARRARAASAAASAAARSGSAASSCSAAGPRRDERAVATACRDLANRLRQVRDVHRGLRSRASAEARCARDARRRRAAGVAHRRTRARSGAGRRRRDRAGRVTHSAVDDCSVHDRGRNLAPLGPRAPPLPAGVRTRRCSSATDSHSSAARWPAGRAAALCEMRRSQAYGSSWSRERAITSSRNFE